MTQAPENIYHAADNSLGGIFGGLLNTAVGVGTNLLTNAIVPKADAKQQALTTPGAKPVAVAPSSFNWKPWAIGGGIVAAVIAGAFLLFRGKKP